MTSTSEKILEGKAFVYGDDINTDVIIPARYCIAYTAEELAPHALADLDPEFVKKVQPGDFIVAGRNFGCGSSREHAPLSIKAAGVGAVIARSFARIFYRNSFNIGLPILECDQAVDAVKAGDGLQVNLDTGQIVNTTRGETYQANPIPEFMQELVDAGGLVGFVRKKLTERGKV